MKWYTKLLLAWYSVTILLLAGALLAESARLEYLVLAGVMIIVGIIGLIIFKGR